MSMWTSYRVWRVCAFDCPEKTVNAVSDKRNMVCSARLDPSGKEICKSLCRMCCVVRVVQRTLIIRFYIVYYVFNLEAVYLEAMGCGRNCFISLFLSAFSTYQYLQVSTESFVGGDHKELIDYSRLL